MAETSIVKEGLDQLRGVYENLEDEVTRVQKQMKVRRRKLEKRIDRSRKDVEKRLSTSRKDIEKRINTRRKDLEKRSANLRKELLKNPTIKRLDGLRLDATKQYEEGVETFLSALQIASKTDVQRIDRKISQLNRKLREMEKGKSAGKAA